MTEDQLRNVAADSMAQGFIVELLLTDYLKRFGESRFELAEKILDAGERTDHFAGLVKDIGEAEAFSDVVIRMHTALDGYIGRALTRIDADKSGDAAQVPRSV